MQTLIAPSAMFSDNGETSTPSHPRDFKEVQMYHESAYKKNRASLNSSLQRKTVIGSNKTSVQHNAHSSYSSAKTVSNKLKYDSA